MTVARTIPAESSAAYLAAALIHRIGPIPRADLLERIEFSERPCNAGQALNAVIRSGWLTETREGIALSVASRHHFGPPQKAKSDYVGVKAAPREPLKPLYEGQLSAKYRVSSAGFRDDVPAFSVRECVRFSTLGGRTA